HADQGGAAADPRQQVADRRRHRVRVPGAGGLGSHGRNGQVRPALQGRAPGLGHGIHGTHMVFVRVIRAMRGSILSGLVLLALTSSAAAQSAFTARPGDPAAADSRSATFGARGDGTTDDSGPLQAAVDAAARTPNGGLLFVPSGRYGLPRTIYVWRGVRVIGYAATRPVLLLAANTPGYQKGIGLMVMFSHAGRPGAPAPPGNTRVPFPPPGMVPPRDDLPDAGPSTFYSAMSNVDFEI